MLTIEPMTKQQTELQRRLHEVLEARGLKATPTSEQMGLSKNALGKILRGETDYPEKESLEAIARFFGWSINDVVMWAGLVPPRDEADFDVIREVDRVLMRAKLPESRRQFVRDAVRYVMPKEPPSSG